MTDHPEEIRRIVDSVEPVTAAEVFARSEADPVPARTQPSSGSRRSALVLGGVSLAIVLVVVVIALRPPRSSIVDTSEDGTTIPTTTVGPPRKVLAPVGDDPIVTCNRTNPNWFPVSAWSGQPSGEGLDLPAAVVLERMYAINDMAKTNGVIPPYPDVPITSWRLLSADESVVLWGLGELDMDLVALDTIGPILTFVKAEKIDGEWQSAEGGGGSCNELYVQPLEGASIGWWALTEPTDPRAAAFSITLRPMVSCAAPLSAEDILGPDIVETADSVSIRVAIDRPPPTNEDLLDCRLSRKGPSWPTTTTITVQLSAPLGDRVLFDAGEFPARAVDRKPMGPRNDPETTEPP